MNTANADTNLKPVEQLQEGDVTVSNGEEHTVRRITGSVKRVGKSATVRYHVDCYDGYSFRQDFGYQIKVRVTR